LACRWRCKTRCSRSGRPDSRSLSGGGIEQASIAVGPFFIGVLPLIVLICATLLTGGLDAVLRFTRFGRSLRAASADVEAAAMTGVNPKRVYAAATAIAVAILGFAATFQAMRSTVAPADGPFQLIYAFEAVIIGGLGSIWGAFVGAMVLGVSQAVGFRISPGFGILAGHLVFLIVLAVRPQGLWGANEGARHEHPADDSPPPVRVQRQMTGSGLVVLVLSCVAVVAIALMPLWASQGLIRDVVTLCCYIAVAQMWNLLAGYAGLVSVGQQAFIGVGAYMMFVLAQTYGVNPFLAAGSASSPRRSLRCRPMRCSTGSKGPYFAIGTWVVAEAMRLIMTNVPMVNGGAGMSLRVMSDYSADERAIGVSMLCGPPCFWSPSAAAMCCCAAATALP
jgi:ABC-type branched-subunit amino acid transport system permease subunit